MIESFSYGRSILVLLTSSKIEVDDRMTATEQGQLERLNLLVGVMLMGNTGPAREEETGVKTT
jgi:hypothetical protein